MTRSRYIYLCLFIIFIMGLKTAWSSGINFNDTDSPAPSSKVGNFGIGTSTPQARLAVVGGNVGIGTWTAAAALDTNGFRLSTNGNSGYVLVSGSTGIGTWMAPTTLPSSGGSSGWSTGTGTVYTSTGTDNVGIGTSTPQGGLVVTNGNVGIGTWRPAYDLDVNGRAKFNSGVNSAITLLNPGSGLNIQLDATGSTTWYIGAGASGNSVGAGKLFFSRSTTTSTSDAVFDTNGNFGVGTITPQTKMVVMGGNVGINTLTSMGALQVNALGANPFVVDATGNVGIGTWLPQVSLQLGGNATSIFGTKGVASLVAPYITFEHSYGVSYSGPFLAVTAGPETYPGYSSVIVGSTNTKQVFSLIGGRAGNGSNWGGTFTAVANGHYLPAIGFAGQTSTGSNGMAIGASIQGQVDGTVSASVIPTSLIFNTSQTNSVDLKEQMRITSAGNVGIGSFGSNTMGNKFVVIGNVGVGTGFSSGYIANSAPNGGMIVEGNVGFGTTTPQTGLAVMSNVGFGTWTATTRLDTDGFRLMNNGAAAGSVLVSSSTGIGTWMAPTTLPSSGGSNGWSTGTGTVYSSTGSDKVGIGTSTPQGGFVVTNGNVGIGTWAPVQLVDIRVGDPGSAIYPFRVSGKRAGGIIGSIYLENDSTVLDTSTQIAFGNQTYGLLASIGSIITSPGYAGLNFFTVDGSSYGERMRIDQSGNVGIGTKVPQGKLIVINGNVGIGTWKPVSALAINGNIAIGTGQSSNFLTSTAPNGGMIVEGNVGIGTTSSQAKLAVLGNVGIGTWTATNGSLIVMGGNVGIGTALVPSVLSLKGSFSQIVTTLTDAATVATDASLGNHFRVTLGGQPHLG